MVNLSTLLVMLLGIVFIFQLISPVVTELFMFIPSHAFFEPWRFFTSMFLHDPSGILHLLFNAYALLLFGSVLERKVTKKDYLLIFIIGGLIGGFFYYLTYLFGIIPNIPALGASGAIYAILGAVAMLLPDMVIYMWFFPMKMRYAAVVWVFLEFIGTFNIGSGVASAAHLGGLLFGLAYGWYLTKNPPVVPRPSSPWEQ